MAGLFARAQGFSDWLVDLRRDFHRHPELAFQEVRTAGRVRETLGGLGYDHVESVAGTGVLALVEGTGPGPTVALRADMDALSIREIEGREYGSVSEGVMHACGHDAHTAMLLGAARLLRERRSGMPGRVLLLFQPAEESITGARRIVQEGVLERHDVKAVFGIHVFNELPAGTVGINRDRTCAAVDNFRAVIKGRKAHGAYPHLGTDAILAAARTVECLQSIVSRETDPMDTAVVTVGSIRGGTGANILAGEVVLEGTLRSHSEKTRERIRRRAEETVRTVAALAGGEGTFERTVGCPSLTNDPALAEGAYRVAESLTGPGGTKWLEHPTMGGEDFAFYLERVPGAFLRLGSGRDGEGQDGPAHSSTFDIDESCLPLGAALLAGMALNYLDGTCPL